MSEFSQLPIHPHIQRVAERGKEPRRFQLTSGRIPGAMQERLSLLDRWQARYGIGDDTSVAQADLTYTNPAPQPPAEPNHPLSEVARSIAIAKSTTPGNRPPGESQPPQTFRVSRKAVPPDAVVPKSATATDSSQTSSLAPGETPIVNRQRTPQSAIQPPGKPTPLSRLLRLRSVQVRSIQAELFPPPQPSAPPTQAAVNPQSARFSQQRERSPQTPPATSPADASVQAIAPTTRPQSPTHFPIAQAKPIPSGDTHKTGFIQRASSRSTPLTQQPPTHHSGNKPVAKGKVTGTRAEIPFASSLQRNRIPLRLSSATTSQSPASPAASVPTSSPSPTHHLGDKQLPMGESVATENVTGVSVETPLATAPTAYLLQRTTKERTMPVARAVSVSSQPPSVQRQPNGSLTVPNSPGHLPSPVSRALATAAPPHQQDAEHSSASDRAIASTQSNRPVAIADAVPTPVTAAAPEMVWRKSATTSPEPAFSRPPTPGNGHSPPPIIQTAPAQSSQTREAASPPARGMTTATPSQSVNVAQLAEQVSRILYRQLRVERERRGMSP
jgi:hypothetical protein